MSKRPKRLAIFWAAIVLFLSLAPSSGLSGERIALLIGNSAYSRPEMALRNPKNDVVALAASLRELGFQVTEAINQDLAGMESVVTEFRRAAKNAEMALFFYAGHGVQIGGENHLIATEFNGADTAALKRSSLKMAQVRNAFEDARPEIGILILDACRNNPFTDSGVVADGLVRSKGGVGLLIAYATDPGNLAFDGVGANSVFTNALLNHIDTPGLDARLMLGRVRQQVVLETRGQQVPWVEEAVLGEHFFAPARTGSDGAALSDPLAEELRLWRQISSSPDPTGFIAYLRDYPNGLFKEFATDRITRLEAAARVSRADQASTTALIASADIDQVSAALVALGLMPAQRSLTRAVEADVLPALNGYRQQLADPEAAGLEQLFNDASSVSMFLAATTLQRIRTDIVALRGVDRTLIIATDALRKITEIANEDPAALAILQSAQNDVAAIRQSRAKILRRLDQSRSYYDEVLNRAVTFVPQETTVALIGGGDRARDLAAGNRQLIDDARLFLKHVSEADEATKGSYAWLIDILPQD